ncbi:MAG TPA: phosphoribosyl-ATP diphosphatase [Cyclobacteriaceae bacterium]
MILVHNALNWKLGINKVIQEVGEEAVELVIEAKDDDKEKFLNEAADLTYHYVLLLAAKDVSLDNVLTILNQRAYLKNKLVVPIANLAALDNSSLSV